jgi:hypothetical protein
VLIEISQGIKTFCAIFKNYFLRKSFTKILGNQMLSTKLYCFQGFEIMKVFSLEK